MLTKKLNARFLFLRGFRQFLSEFTMFLKTVFQQSALKLPLISADCHYYAYYAYVNIIVESIKLITIIEAKMGQSGRRSKFAIFY